MNSCEYYQRLISDSLDGPLSPEQELELRDHLTTCTACATFRSTSIEQAGLLRSLPAIKSDKELSLDESRIAKQSRISRLWHSRVSFPAPLAAGIAAMIIGLGIWISINHRSAANPAPGSASETVNYVQVERISPASAVRIPKTERP